MQNQTTVDVIGAIVDIGGVSSIRLKSGDTKERLNITIADDTNHSVPVTVWGDMCQPISQKLQQGDIVAFKSSRVSEYQGRGLNASPAASDIVTNV